MGCLDKIQEEFHFFRLLFSRAVSGWELIRRVLRQLCFCWTSKPSFACVDTRQE